MSKRTRGALLTARHPGLDAGPFPFRSGPLYRSCITTNVPISTPALESVVELGRGQVRPSDTVLPPGGCDRCQVITKGAVSIRLGERAVEVDLLGPGELLNIGAILGPDTNEHLGIALTDCETFTFPAGTLKRLTKERPQLEAIWSHRGRIVVRGRDLLMAKTYQ